MKKILIILAHPKPGSFNHAIADTVKQAVELGGNRALLRDLYQEKFDPVYGPDELEKDYKPGAKLKEYCEELVSADGLVVVHPNWWGQPPAILKGWLDRVVRQGVAYRFEVNAKGEGVPVGLLKIKTAIVFSTSNTPREVETKVLGDPLENLWKVVILGFCGIPTVVRRNFESMIMSTAEERAGWLEEVRSMVQKNFSVR